MSNENSQSNTGGSQRGGSGNFANDPQRASEAGRKGGQQSQSGSGGTQSGSSVSPPNQGGQNQTDKAREAGRKGGEQSQGGQSGGDNRDNRENR